MRRGDPPFLDGRNFKVIILCVKYSLNQPLRAAPLKRRGPTLVLACLPGHVALALNSAFT